MANTTAKDIAKKLGISAASVSVALNGKPGVSEATRARILQAAAELGYSFPQKVTALPSRVICFLIYIDPDVGIAQESNFYTFVLKGVESVAKSNGYRVLIRYYYVNQPFMDQISDILPDISGMIILGTDFTLQNRTNAMALITEVGKLMPILVVDSFLFSAYVDCVGNDSLYGAKSAISYLIELGHRHIGYLRVRQRGSNFDEREYGIRIALSERMPQGAPPLEIIDVDVSAERASRDISLWLQQKTKLPSALFAESDIVAAAAIRVLSAHGIRMPQDISVMGFDNVSICEMVDPTITTVHAFKETLGVSAMKVLHKRIEYGHTVLEVQNAGVVKLAISMKIIERESTAPFQP